MKCQKCGNENINEAVICSNCGSKLKIQPKQKIQAQNQQRSAQFGFKSWLIQFIQHLIKPKGFKLWIIVGSFVCFALVPLIVTLGLYIVMPYVQQWQRDRIAVYQKVSPQEQAQLKADFDLVMKTKAKLKDIQDRVQVFYTETRHYPKSLSVLKGINLDLYPMIKMQENGYLVTEINTSRNIKMYLVPFIVNQKLHWDCYLSGIDSSQISTGCIEVSTANDIPQNNISIDQGAILKE